METVLSLCVHLTSADSKKNIIVPFSLAKNADELIIRYHYGPKFPEDRELQLRMIEENIARDAPGEWGAEYDREKFLPLKNLVTLSLDDPDGYRGAAHRQDPEQEHRINEKFASPGFYPGKIKKGSWRILLNIHSMVTEHCDCYLDILTEGGEPNET